MRNSIVLDEDLLREAQRYSRAKTKSALVDEALRALVRLHSRAERRPGYEERLAVVQVVQNAVQTKRFGISATELVREDRGRE